MTEPLRIDVCICTFRRSSVVAAMESVSSQAELHGARLRVIIADNDDTPSARSEVLATAKRLGLDATYVHAPARNISVARNACLEASRAPLLAFLDDDEVADPVWLSQLVGTLDEQDADIVFGPVHAIYPANAPAWLKDHDFHSMDVVVLKDGVIRTGYTSNCLIRTEVIGQARFDLRLGQSGGEDTEFFFRLHQAGARLARASQAIVREPVAPSRQSLKWLLKRSFRAGQTHGRLLRASHGSRLNKLAGASLKLLYCAALAGLSVWSKVRFRRALIRGALHAGATAHLLGARDVAIYGESPS